MILQNSLAKKNSAWTICTALDGLTDIDAHGVTTTKLGR